MNWALESKFSRVRQHCEQGFEHREAWGSQLWSCQEVWSSPQQSFFHSPT